MINCGLIFGGIVALLLFRLLCLRAQPLLVVAHLIKRHIVPSREVKVGEHAKHEADKFVGPTNSYTPAATYRPVHGLTNERKKEEDAEECEAAHAKDEARKHASDGTWVELPFGPLVGVVAAISWHEIFQLLYRLSKAPHLVPTVLKDDEAGDGIEHEQDYSRV